MANSAAAWAESSRVLVHQTMFLRCISLGPVRKPVTLVLIQINVAEAVLIDA